MPKININHGLKTKNTVYSYSGSFNGCSGQYMQLTRRNPGQNYYGYGFDRDCSRNFWDVLLNCGGYTPAPAGTNRRLHVLYPEPGIWLPSPRVWFNPPPDFAAYYVKSDDDVLAVIGCAQPAHFTEPTSPAALFISDPEKYVSFAHLEAAGMFHRTNVILRNNKESTGYGKCDATGWTCNQIRAYATHIPNLGLRDVAVEWSRAFRWGKPMPWWERYRLAGMAYPSSEELAQTIADAFFSGRPGLGEYNGLAHVSGNAIMDSPYNSFRAVFCFHALNPAATLDLEATPVVLSSNDRPLYYKVLPFYYHSPQHDDHRVATCFLSEKPIHLERIS
jgi:hypothetical protein